MRNVSLNNVFQTELNNGSQIIFRDWNQNNFGIKYGFWVQKRRDKEFYQV